MVYDPVRGSAPGMRHQIHGAVGFVDGVEGAPAGKVWPVGGAGVHELHVTRILVPGKVHALFTALEDPLLVEQLSVVSERGAADFGHEVAEDELPRP